MNHSCVVNLRDFGVFRSLFRSSRINFKICFKKDPAFCEVFIVHLVLSTVVFTG